MLDPALLQAEVVSDGELQAHEFNRASADALRDGGPWGQGYPEPLFDGEFDVLDWRVVGERHLKLELGQRRHGGSTRSSSAAGRANRRRRACASPSGWSPTTIAAATPIQLVVVHREPCLSRPPERHPNAVAATARIRGPVSHHEYRT